MQYDYRTALELGEQFYLRGIERIDALAMMTRFGFSKYPRCRAAENAFVERAIRCYDRWIEIEPTGFGRMKGKS